MRKFFKLNHPIAVNVTTRPEDVLFAKQRLNDLGFYEPPKWGITPYPDHDLIDAVRNFQHAKGLRVDGVMKPGGETEEAIQNINFQANQLQSMGRHGDTLLAHLSPAEARLLKARGGAGTVNPRTGLLEFYEDDEDNEKKEGEYIWHTVGDSRVRSSHAERDGKHSHGTTPPTAAIPVKRRVAGARRRMWKRRNVNAYARSWKQIRPMQMRRANVGTRQMTDTTKLNKNSRPKSRSWTTLYSKR